MGNGKLHKQSFQKEEVTEAQQLSMVRTEQRPDTLRQRASRSHLVAFLKKKTFSPGPPGCLACLHYWGIKETREGNFSYTPVCSLSDAVCFRTCTCYRQQPTSFVAGVRDSQQAHALAICPSPSCTTAFRPLERWVTNRKTCRVHR